MKNPTVQTHQPFTQPRYAGMQWRAVAITHAPQTLLHWGEEPDCLTIPLPDDLLRAVPKRQAEFLAGRLCAALALQALELPPQVPRLGRAPVWPSGAVGSITHTDTLAVAVASPVHSALGLDCETIMDAAQAADISDMILNTNEAAFRPPFLNFASFVTLVFSAKEALYKGISGRVGRVLEFHEVQLLGLASGSLMLGFEGGIYTINWLIDGSHCFTLYGERQILLDEKIA